MSIDSDPSLYPFGTPPDVCGACFAPGKSPASVFLSFNGIEKGPLADPADPPPPNGIVQIPAAGGCIYSAVLDGITFSLAWTGGDSEAVAVDFPLEFFRSFPVPPACVRHIPSKFQNPAVNKYNFGWCDVIVPSASDPDSLPALLQAMGMPAAPATYVSPRVLDADFDVYTISRRSDASNLHVKIEAI